MQKLKFKDDINNQNLIFVTVTDGTFKGMNFILDTGSNNNVLFARTYQQVKDKMKLSEGNYGITGIDGVRRKTSAAIGDISFFDTTYKTWFIITDADNTAENLSKEMGFSVDGLIGLEFMAKHRWVLDLVAREVFVRPAFELNWK